MPQRRLRSDSRRRRRATNTYAPMKKSNLILFIATAIFNAYSVSAVQYKLEASGTIFRTASIISGVAVGDPFSYSTLIDSSVPDLEPADDVNGRYDALSDSAFTLGSISAITDDAFVGISHNPGFVDDVFIGTGGSATTTITETGTSVPGFRVFDFELLFRDSGGTSLSDDALGTFLSSISNFPPPNFRILFEDLSSPGRTQSVWGRVTELSVQRVPDTASTSLLLGTALLSLIAFRSKLERANKDRL